MAHLTIRTENKAVLPVTETGYRSIYESNEVITDAGGAKAYLIAALDEAAKSKKWKNYLKDNSQLSLF